jgi:hypothetical protein
MSARDELIVKYAADLRDKCGVSPDMDLLTKVTIGCGPSSIMLMLQQWQEVNKLN